MIHVLHVGKTGGTAVKAALQGHPDRFALHRHSVRLSDCPRGEAVFVAIRHPLDRYVSSFNSRLRKGAPRYLFEWSPAEAEAFRHFITPNELGEALSSLNPFRRRRAHRAMLSIRHVRSRLGDWLGSDDYLRSRAGDLVIGLTRTLQTDVDRLLRLAGLEPVLLSTDPVVTHRTPDGMERHLSPAAHANLSRWYAEDFGLYKTAMALRVEALADDDRKDATSRNRRTQLSSSERDRIVIDAGAVNSPC